MNLLPFCFDDGGRAAAGFRGETRDCVTRAISIGSKRDYKLVYEELATLASKMGYSRSVVRTGVPRKVYDLYLKQIGATWKPTMAIGSGCRTHLCQDDIPVGRLICRLSRHLVTVIDGVIHDTHNPSRGGSRCVYGYWEFKDK